ncbi:hypothetical protein SCH4B_4267 [Ruegeria sp. TrichCH4B]|nr:hypothetical protein SCH4B_4267 [Ruegeria sp. TrichCH4B]
MPSDGMPGGVGSAIGVAIRPVRGLPRKRSNRRCDIGQWFRKCVSARLIRCGTSGQDQSQNANCNDRCDTHDNLLLGAR